MLWDIYTYKNNNSKNKPFYVQIVTSIVPLKKKTIRGFATKKEALAFAKEWVENHKDAPVINKKLMFFRDYMEIYLQHCKKNNATGTVYNKKGLYNNHMQLLKEKKVDELKPLFIQNWCDNLLENTSPYTVNDCIKLLKACFNYIKRLQLIKSNPFEFLQKVKLQKKIRKRFSIDEYRNILEICRTKMPDYYLLFVLASLTGMRVGEYIALTTDDIDKEKQEISVVKQFYRGNISPTKTVNSTRIVYISNIVVDAIDFHRKRFSIFSGYLFPSKDKKGFPITSRTVDRYFKNLLEVAGYPQDYMRLHDLRGEYVDIMHTQGIPTVQISRQVGHSSTKITNDVYSAILQDTNDATKTAIDRALNF